MSQMMKALALTGMLVFPGAFAEARDGTRTPPSGASSPYAVPNPYAAPTPAERSSDAYSTGFAIGLAATLLEKQRAEEERRRGQSATVAR